MKKILFYCILSATCCRLAAQDDAAEKYGRYISRDSLEKYLGVIAGAGMEGRETGTEGQRKAAAYIQEQFKRIGLIPPPTMQGYQQFYPLYRDSMTSSTVTINGQQLQYGKDYYVPVLNNKTKTASADKMVFVGYGLSDEAYNDYRDIKVKGKVVVFFLGEPRLKNSKPEMGKRRRAQYNFPGLTQKIEAAQEAGAVAAIVLNPAAVTLSSRTVSVNTTSNVYYPGKQVEKSIGFISLSLQAAKKYFPGWNIDSLANLARERILFDAAGMEEQTSGFSFDYQKEKTQVEASNVIGIIEGTDKKDEYVFLTAHYDHLGKRDGKIYYGADDDGSGTCAVLNMAAAFAKAKAEGHGPRRTLVFMTVSGEEKGLWGSEYYSENPVFPMEQVSVDLNTDMVGRVDTERDKPDSLNYIYVIGHDKISSELQIINEAVNKKYTGLVLDYKYDDPADPQEIYYRSDHYNFARKGVPILFFYDGMLKADYHKPTDTIDKINWELYEKRVRLIFYTAWDMANRNRGLNRNLPIPGGE